MPIHCRKSCTAPFNDSKLFVTNLNMGGTAALLLMACWGGVNLLISVLCLHLRVVCLEEYFGTVLKGK